MSAVQGAAAHAPIVEAPRGVWGPALRSELRRWPRSGAAVIPLAGLAFGAVQFGVVWLSGGASGWSGLVAGNVMWATSLALPVAALLVTLVHIRERRARGGGTWWRAMSPTAAGLSRLTVSAAVIALTNLAVLAPGIIIGALSAPATIPMMRLLMLWGTLTLASIAVLPLLDLVAVKWGTAATLMLAVAWTLGGVLTAEFPHWALIPPAWPIRALLPILGTHANGIALAADDSLAVEEPLPAVLLTLATLALAMAIYLRLRAGARSTRRAIRLPSAGQATSALRAGDVAAPKPARLDPPLVDLPLVDPPLVDVHVLAADQRRRPGLLLGQPASLRRTPLTWLVLAGLFLQLVTALLWHSPRYAEGVSELLLVPVGAVLLGVIGWTSMRAAWPSVALSAQHLGRVMCARLVTLWFILVATVLCAGALTLATGADPARTLRAVLVSVAVGWALLVFAFWLAARFSPAVAAAVNGVGLVVSLVLGAGELAGAYWPFAPWAWVHTAAETWNFSLGIVAAAIALGAACCPLVLSALKRRGLGN